MDKYLDIVLNWRATSQQMQNMPMQDMPMGDTPDTEDDDTLDLTERQTAMYDVLNAIVEAYGQFDKSSGPDGAHFMTTNPFLSEGIKCENCVFWEEGTCELVTGDIGPDDLCKLWVIPASKLTAS